MLNEFINAYKKAFFREFGGDFYGRFKKFQSLITDPKFRPGAELINELSALDLFICEPLNVAIVGQFSSGKSTFLNALLGCEILPTGLTPVTAKLTHIKYGENYALRVDYENGKELNLNIDQIGKFVDQRIFTDDVKELCIYAPSEILKSVSFIDTPGLNSLSSADTAVTKELLDSVGAVIWLSLADNAGRASELKDIREFLEGKGKIAIFALNQKDKLSESELQNVLNHCENTFKDLFSSIVAVSAKQALEALKNNDEDLLKRSNFGEILKCVKALDVEAIKRNFVIKRCEDILGSIIFSHEYFGRIYKKALDIIENFDRESSELADKVKREISPKLELAFNEIKSAAKLISDEILSSLKPKTRDRFVRKKSVLGKEIFERIAYVAVDIDADEIFSRLIYNDVKLDKFFKIYRRNLKLLESEIDAAIGEIYRKLEYRFLLYKSEFENIVKESAVHSDERFSAIRTYAGQVYALFLRDYEAAKFKQSQKIALFFERLNLKVVSNYENAVKISVYSIKEKIDAARISYEKDPLRFSLFIPSAVDVSNAVLNSLSLYEFESEMLSNVSFLNKSLNELSKDFKETRELKVEKINELISKNDEILRELRDIGDFLKSI